MWLSLYEISDRFGTDSATAVCLGNGYPVRWVMNVVVDPTLRTNLYWLPDVELALSMAVERTLMGLPSFVGWEQRHELKRLWHKSYEKPPVGYLYPTEFT